MYSFSYWDVHLIGLTKLDLYVQKDERHTIRIEIPICNIAEMVDMKVQDYPSAILHMPISSCIEIACKNFEILRFGFLHDTTSK